MQKIVQKFGGTSVGTIDRIRNICSLINKEMLKDLAIKIFSNNKEFFALEERKKTVQ